MKLIILDRDGVINQDSDNFIKSVDEFIPLPGSIEAIARLKHAGYKVYVATNQSGISRGFYTVETLHAMHKKLADLLKEHNTKIDGIEFCPHGPDDNCDCRKPKAAKPHLVKTGKGERTIKKDEGLDGIPVYTDLNDFVNQLVKENV